VSPRIVRLTELARQRRRYHVIVDRDELVDLQCAIDDCVSAMDPATAPPRWLSLQRRLHALSGEPLSPNAMKHDGAVGRRARKG
jgi:hypothetical protein